MSTGKVWTRDFISIWGINFFLTMVMYLLMATIPSYAVQEFKVSSSIAGLASGIFIIGALIGRLTIGRMITDIESKKVLLIGLLFYITTTALYFLAVSLPLMLANRLLHGIAYGIASTAAGTIMAQIIPHHRRGEGIGYYGMSAILATAIGPFFGLFLTQHTTFSSIFIVNLCLALVTLVIALVVRGTGSQTSLPEREEKSSKTFQVSNFVELKALPISVVSLIVILSYSSLLSFMSFYSREIHLEKAASFFFIVYALAVLVSRPFSGRLFDIKGANIVIYPCLFILAAGMFLLSQAHYGIILLLSGALIGLGYGNYISSSQAIAIKNIPPHRLGLATATFFIFMDLGAGVGPYLIGLIVPFTGYRNLYLIMVFVVFAAIILYYFLYGKKAQQIQKH